MIAAGADLDGDRWPDSHILAGLAPLGAFNALVRPASAGALILVDVGLLDLVAVTTSLLIGTMPFQQAGTPELLPPTIASEEGAMRFAVVLRAFRAGEPLPLDVVPHLVDEPRRCWGGAIMRTLDFILGHELAHLALDHFTPADRDFSSSPWGTTVDDSIYSQQQEVEADHYAMELILRLRESQESFEFPYVGAIVLTQLASIVQSHFDPLGTHSHPRQRLYGIIYENLSGRAYDDEWPLCDLYLHSFGQLLGQPMQEADPEALRTLIERWDNLKQHFDVDRYARMVGINIRVGGLRAFNLSQAAEYMGQSITVAMAVVTFAVAIYRKQSLVLNVEPGRNLSATHSAFDALYLGPRASKEAREFDALVKLCVPEMGALSQYSEITAMAPTTAINNRWITEL